MHDVLVENGIDPSPALEESAIDPAAMSAVGVSVTGRQEVAFQSAFVHLTSSRRDLWSTLGLRYTLPTLGTHGFALMTAPTMQDWVRAVVINSDLYYSMCDLTPIEGTSAVVGLRVDYTETPPDLVEFSVHRDLAIAIGMHEQLYEAAFPYSRVAVPIAGIDARLQEKMDVAVELNAEALCLEWSEAVSNRNLPHGDAHQFQTYLNESRDRARQFQFADDWMRALTTAMTRSSPMVTGLSELARLLNVSERTLQRRLRSLNISFRDLRDQARFAIAREALANSNVLIADLAFRLGYSEPTAFATAFKRWAGCSPTAFRSDPSSWSCDGASSRQLWLEPRSEYAG
ncbi:helix-turn-helix domain-containing protein [Nocardioides sp. NPDC051685]|uniref:AraC family transcriptional regulator n=1 Tax=Nocardioides sp. NPDC051685 TaxID=3364334 RepID=UPI0037B4DC25